MTCIGPSSIVQDPSYRLCECPYECPYERPYECPCGSLCECLRARQRAHLRLSADFQSETPVACYVSSKNGSHGGPRARPAVRPCWPPVSPFLALYFPPQASALPDARVRPPSPSWSSARDRTHLAGRCKRHRHHAQEPYRLSREYNRGSMHRGSVHRGSMHRGSMHRGSSAHTCHRADGC